MFIAIAVIYKEDDDVTKVGKPIKSVCKTAMCENRVELYINVNLSIFI